MAPLTLPLPYSLPLSQDYLSVIITVFNVFMFIF